MSRLDALVEALPRILLVVEPINDAALRYRAFDALAQAAIDDWTAAKSKAPGAARCGSGQYGTPAPARPATGTDTATYNLDTGYPTPGEPIAAVVDLPGQRIVGTYTPTSDTGGTFAPTTVDVGNGPVPVPQISPAVEQLYRGGTYATGGPVEPSPGAIYDSVRDQRP